MFRVLLSLLLSVSLITDAYKILVYSPKFGHSHSHFMGRIADILAEAGHDVTTLISVIDPDLSDCTKLSKIIRVQPDSTVARQWKEMINAEGGMFAINNYSPIWPYMMGNFFSGLFVTQCRVLLEEPELVEKLKAERFDVLFAEQFDMCGVGLVDVIKPRSLISVSASSPTGPQIEEFGIPTALSVDPVHYPLNVHSMWDRMVNIYSDFLTRMMFNQMRTKTQALFKEKFGPNFPTFEEISSNSAYVFTNTESLIDFAIPTISKVIPIGGILAAKPNKLDEHWEKILSKREKNVLLSFGSVAKAIHLPMSVKLSIVQTVKALPNVTFIWKYEEDDDFTKEIASKISNLELTKWMPQVDLLAHPNLSLFITHGGMASTQETAQRGIPGIFVPIFGDQSRNSGMMEHNMLGKVLDKYELADSAKFVAIITEVLEDENYRSSARRVSDMLHKKPFTAKEQLIKYTEFAAEFGPSKALRPQSHDMNWIEYHNVDIFMLALAVVSIAGFLTLAFVTRLMKLYLKMETKKKID